MKYGWEKGKGLGKNEDGITDYIKVTKKNDNSGIGKVVELKDFRWWANVYNSTSDKISVSENTDTIIMEKNIHEDKDVYGSVFVKNSHNLLDSENEKDIEVRNEENNLINACEGRTLKQRALYSDNKLKRLQEYDKALSLSFTKIPAVTTDNAVSLLININNCSDDKQEKKKNKKHKRKKIADEDSIKEKHKKKRKLKEKAHKKKSWKISLKISYWHNKLTLWDTRLFLYIKIYK